jgi:hypothetical protein
MPQLRNLPGIEAKHVDAEFFFSSDKVEGILNDGLAATTAGDNGAINVWKDDNGYIRCEIMRYCKLVETKRFRKMVNALNWTDKWLPQIGVVLENEED